MKIALYIEDGFEQIVLTPESKVERAILEKIHDGSRAIELKRGAFYGVRGGWIRWADPPPAGVFHRNGIENDDDSTMIVLRPRQEVAK